jgi:hypothetical protein
MGGYGVRREGRGEEWGEEREGEIKRDGRNDKGGGAF